MTINSEIFPEFIQAISEAITLNSDELTELDKAIGDGDHVVNLQRGISALLDNSEAISQLEWATAIQKIGMLCMSKIGGAAGSLLGTLFVAMAKKAQGQNITVSVVAEAFTAGVESMKLRGKADVGEKTMLDVLIPVAELLQKQAGQGASTDLLIAVKQTAIAGMESTRHMQATKGRASFLGERSIGHIDAGAKSSQLMICAIADVLLQNQSIHAPNKT